MNSLADGPSDALAGALNATATSPAEAAEILAVLIQEAPQWAVIAGSLAPIVTTLLRLSPIPTVYSFYRRKSVGSLPLMPYTALLSDSLLWLCFGKLKTLFYRNSNICDRHDFLADFVCSIHITSIS